MSDKTNTTKNAYISPLCETHVIVPEGMICVSGGPGSYDDDHTNNLGGWF